MSSSYAYYSQAPAWGTQGYQMGSPPEPSYVPQSSWGGLDYYRAQFGGSGIDDSLYNNAWNRLQGLGGNIGGMGSIGMGGVPVDGMGGMGVGGMGGMGSVGGPMGGVGGPMGSMGGIGGVGGIGGMGGMGRMGGVGGMGMGGIGGMEGMGTTEAAGIGKAQARYWHRRVYGALTDLRMVLPVHLGAAAAYEAWRAWKRHSTILSQPLGGSRPRQREALIGLAVGEAARLFYLFTYAGRQMDQAGQMQVTEIAAMIASRIFTESWGLEEGALGMGAGGGLGVSGITGPGGLPPRARSLSPYRAAPSMSDRVSEEVAAERVAEEVAANAERSNMPRISPRSSPIPSQGVGMGINAGVPGSLNEGMPVVPGGIGMGMGMSETGVPGAGYNMPGPFPGGFAPSGGGIGATGQGYGPEMMRGRYGLGPGGGGIGLGGGMPGYGPYGATSGSMMGYGGGYRPEMQGYAGIPRQSEPPVVIHMHKPRRRRSHSRHRHRRHRSLSPSYDYDDRYRGNDYGYSGGYRPGIRI